MIQKDLEARARANAQQLRTELDKLVKESQLALENPFGMKNRRLQAATKHAKFVLDSPLIGENPLALDDARKLINECRKP